MSRELPLGLLMFVGYRATEDRIFAALERAGAHDITRAQGRLLAGMDADGTRVVTLAERARVPKQTAVSMLDRLEEAGYVERTVDPRDRRARLVRFTDKGRRLLPVVRAEEQSIDEEWSRALGPVRERRLREALQVLSDLVDPM
jgi:DNA-binding MarR family transcriptional regulator